MEVAASKGRRGSTNDGLAPEGPPAPGQVPVGGFEKDVEATEAVTAGGEEVVTSRTSVFDGQVALRNHVVLTRLFEVCDQGDLATFRLVCKEWRDLSLKTWRASSTLKLKRNSADGGLNLKGGTPLDEFVEYVEDPGNECGAKPFRRIKLEGWIFCRPTSNIQTQRFWNLLGWSLNSLEFFGCKFPSVEELRRIIYTACPNLILLSFRYCTSENDVLLANELPTRYQEPAHGERLKLKSLSILGDCPPVSWLELFSHFQSLTSFKLHPYWSLTIMGGGLEGMLNAIRIIRGHDAQKLPLEQFDIEHPYIGISPETASQDKIFGLMRQLNLPLKSMTLQLDPGLNEEFTNDVLQFHSETLEGIMVTVTEQGEPIRMFNCRVQLPKVEKLEIVHALFQSTGILKCVPNLKSLIIEEDWARRGTRTVFQEWKEELERNEAVKLRNVTYFDYIVNNEFGTFNNSGALETLTTLLPNVEELVMALDDEQFAIVCQHWKGLKKLTVDSDRDHDLSDKGLTGGILHMTNKVWKHETFRPNIKDLTELRVFSCNSNRLTDISFYHGFLQLPQLKSVILDMAEDERPPALGLGEEAQQDLREKGVELKIIKNLAG